MGETSDLEALRQASLDLVERAKSETIADLATAIDKATTALRFVEEQRAADFNSEKQALELRKLRHEVATAKSSDRSTRRRDYATLVTPLAAILGLIATSVLQTSQTLSQLKAAERQQAVAADEAKRKDVERSDAEWNSFVGSLGKLTKRSPDVVNIRKFIEQERYRDRAQALAAGILTETTDASTFEDVFKGAFAPVDAKNLPEVVRVDRAFSQRANPLWTKSWNPTLRDNDYRGKLTKDEYDIVMYTDTALPTLSNAVGAYLKSRSPQDQQKQVDLYNTAFNEADWSGADLNGADLSYSNMTRMDFKGASLKGLRGYQDLVLNYTAWWQAREIQPDLRRYLVEHSPCMPSLSSRQGYGPTTSLHLTQSDCDAVMAEQKKLVADGS